MAMAKLRKWNQKMQEMAKAFQDLLPELSDSQPITPATQKKLEKGTKRLLDFAHTINMGPDTKGNPLPPEADPTIGFVSNLFEREVKHAYRALQSGHTAYARSVLRTMTGYCIACHTRHDRGPDFPTFDLNPKTASLTRMQRAELLTATRQFDAALDEFEAVVSDTNLAKARPFEWGRAIRNAFTISIRVKKDPDRTLAFMDKVLTLPELPGFYADNIPAWRKAILQWKSEQGKTINTEEGLFLEAARLSKEARDMQAFPIDHSADVLYLRSSAVVHELLTQYPRGRRTSEALLLAGAAYDVLDDRLISPLPELYYEACIRNSPHSEVAEQCHQRFEQNMFFGYSGSGGTFLPDDIKELMGELRKLARVKRK
jgi:hypothetical protein